MSESLPVQAPEPTDEARETELWQVLDWSLWGNGLADVLRFPMADVMVAALSEEQREQAEACIKAWHERRGPSMAVGVGTALERERNELRAAYGSLHEVVRAFLEAELTQSAPASTWACDRCGSPRWAGWRNGPEHEGWPRKAQCVPCGHVQDLPLSEVSRG